MKPYTFETTSRSSSARAKTSRTRRAATRRRNSASARRQRRRCRSSSARRARLHRREHPQPALTASRLSVGGIGTESYLAAQTTDAAYVKADVLVHDKLAVRRRAALGGVPAGLAADRHAASTTSPSANARWCRATPRRSRSIMFAEDDVYPALAMTRILRDVWARGLPDPRRLERNGRAARSARDLGLELHRSVDRDAHPRQPGARDVGHQQLRPARRVVLRQTATTSRPRCSTRTSRIRSRRCKAPAPTTISR